MHFIVQHADCRTNPPSLGGRVSVYSFNPHHDYYKDPGDFGLFIKQGEVTSSNPGIRQRLATRTAFPLSCCEHCGGYWWHYSERCHYCDRSCATPGHGILFVKRERGEHPESRFWLVREYLKQLNEWCHGSGYEVFLEDSRDNTIDSAWVLGFYEIGEVIGEMKKKHGLRRYEIIENWPAQSTAEPQRRE